MKVAGWTQCLTRAVLDGDWSVAANDVFIWNGTRDYTWFLDTSLKHLYQITHKWQPEVEMITRWHDEYLLYFWPKNELERVLVKELSWHDDVFIVSRLIFRSRPLEYPKVRPELRHDLLEHEFNFTCVGNWMMNYSWTSNPFTHSAIINANWRHLTHQSHDSSLSNKAISVLLGRRICTNCWCCLWWFWLRILYHYGIPRKCPDCKSLWCKSKSKALVFFGSNRISE